MTTVFSQSAFQSKLKIIDFIIHLKQSINIIVSSGRAVRALDFQLPIILFEGPEFKSCPGRLLDLFALFCFNHLIGPTSISAITTAEGK